MTTTTTMDWTLATACEPNAFSTDIATTSSAANAFVANAESSAPTAAPA